MPNQPDDRPTPQTARPGAADEPPDAIDPWAQPRHPSIRLDQFLKWQGLCDTGGQAKIRIQYGEVMVNGEVETRRGRTLYVGDCVELEGRKVMVELAEPGGTGNEG